MGEDTTTTEFTVTIDGEVYLQGKVDRRLSSMEMIKLHVWMKDLYNQAGTVTFKSKEIEQ